MDRTGFGTADTRRTENCTPVTTTFCTALLGRDGDLPVMEFESWLDSWEAVSEEFRKQADEAQEAERAKAKAAGSTRFLLLPNGGPKANAYVQEECSRLVELLNQNAHLWHDELAEFAGCLTQKAIEDTFPAPVQWQALRSIASQVTLSPEAIAFAVDTRWVEEQDVSAMHLFLSQAPFSTQNLARSDMQRAFADFLDDWSGGHVVHPVFSDVFLTNLSDEVAALGMPLHAAAIIEYDLAFNEDEITSSGPETLAQELLDLLLAYTDMRRSGDANRVQARLDDLAADGVVVFDLYNDLAVVLAGVGREAPSDEQRLRTEDALCGLLGQLWRSIQDKTIRLLIRAETAFASNEVDQFCESARLYWMAIEAEWTHQVERRWGERLDEEAKRTIHHVILGRPAPGRMVGFLRECPNAGFLHAGGTLELLRTLKKLRNALSHAEEVDPAKVRDSVERLWAEGFLRRYFEALVVLRPPAELNHGS